MSMAVRSPRSKRRFIVTYAAGLWFALGAGKTTRALLERDWPGLQSLWLGERLVARLVAGVPMALLAGWGSWVLHERRLRAATATQDPAAGGSGPEAG